MSWSVGNLSKEYREHGDNILHEASEVVKDQMQGAKPVHSSRQQHIRGRQ